MPKVITAGHRVPLRRRRNKIHEEALETERAKRRTETPNIPQKIRAAIKPQKRLSLSLCASPAAVKLCRATAQLREKKIIMKHKRYLSAAFFFWRENRI